MLLSRLFEENALEDWMDDFVFPREFDDIGRKLYGRHEGREMLTDVRDHGDHYELEIDLPGFKKDQIQVELHKGNLTVSASKGLDKDEKNKDGTYVRQERYSGMMQRTFHVGEEVKQEDIKAKFEDGVLHLEVPKKEETKQIPEKHTITIE